MSVWPPPADGGGGGSGSGGDKGRLVRLSTWFRTELLLKEEKQKRCSRRREESWPCSRVKELCVPAAAHPAAAAAAAIYCCAAECNASSNGFKSSGRLLGFCENYGNAGEMDEQHFITINQGPLINKVHFLFSMIQGIIKRTLSLSL